MSRCTFMKQPFTWCTKNISQIIMRLHYGDWFSPKILIRLRNYIQQSLQSVLQCLNSVKRVRKRGIASCFQSAWLWLRNRSKTLTLVGYITLNIIPRARIVYELIAITHIRRETVRTSPKPRANLTLLSPFNAKTLIAPFYSRWGRRWLWRP